MMMMVLFSLSLSSDFVVEKVAGEIMSFQSLVHALLHIILHT